MTIVHFHQHDYINIIIIIAIIILRHRGQLSHSHRVRHTYHSRNMGASNQGTEVRTPVDVPCRLDLNKDVQQKTLANI